MPEDRRIVMPGDLPPQTDKQRAQTLQPEEMPECAGNPQAPCRGGVTDFMIKGYDDKHRCKLCNDLHIELVMQEAGDSAPGSQPQFVAPKLNKRAEDERLARIEAMHQKLSEGSGIVNKQGVPVDGQTKGARGLPKEHHDVVQADDGDFLDMKDAMARDVHNTRAEGISDEERRARILAKYGKRNDGNAMR